MAVMRETRLIVISTVDGTLYQFSLQEGRLIKKEIQPPCTHGYLFLLRVQVTGQEYLALSCGLCGNIKLMDFNKQAGNSSESQLIQYEAITAFSGKHVGRMCQSEENRIFVQSHGNVLELDTSTTTFIKVRTINTSSTALWKLYSLCYVPDPHRLIVVGDENEVRAVSFVEKKVMWKTKLKPGCLLYAFNHDVLFLSDRSNNKVVCLDPGSGSQLQEISLPVDVQEIGAMCLVNNQIIVASSWNISHYSLK